MAADGVMEGFILALSPRHHGLDVKVSRALRGVGSGAGL
jgi:hypothetical protein